MIKPGYLSRVASAFGARSNERDAQNLVELAENLLSERGEASGVALASKLLETYQALQPDARGRFLQALATTFGPDSGQLAEAIARYNAKPDALTSQRLHAAAEPRRQELIRRMNLAPGGTQALVQMRADLLDRLKANPELACVDTDFAHLFSSWFNRGFLQLRRIDWSTPADILAKVIRYEAVHAIKSWDDLRLRIEPPDRRCFAFFHPALPDEPLIFVEVALTEDIPDAIAPLLAVERKPTPPRKASTAVFYSISNCQTGLRGVSFGHYLIKQVVDELKAEMPGVKTFTTLSPVPGFMRWLNKAKPQLDGRPLGELLAEGWQARPTSELRRAFNDAAIEYFFRAKDAQGRPIDPVARFHLWNGARLERINWLGDVSAKGLAEAAGFMVNYVYDVERIERNHEAFAREGEVIASARLKRAAGKSAELLAKEKA